MLIGFLPGLGGSGPNPVNAICLWHGAGRGFFIHIRKIEYYRDEYDITVFLTWKLIEWAGLKDKVEGKFIKTMCLGDDVCEWIFEAKSGDLGK